MAAATYDDPPRRRGMSLAKGPVGLMGLASLAFGILGYALGSAGSRSFTMHPLRGIVNGGTFLGVEGNGWTWALFAAGGLLLLLGSRLHWGAKTTAMIVGIAYGVGALIALSDGTDILGIFATNNWTKLVMGIGGIVLIALSMAPRVGRRRGTAPAVAARPVGTRRRFGRTAPAAREPVAAGPTRDTTDGTLDDRR
jgi:hypothetical protein